MPPPRISTVTALTLYPLKGARGFPVQEMELDERGPVGDRRWMLVDDNGRFVSLRETTRLCFVSATLRPGGLRINLPGEADVDVDDPDPRSAAHVMARVWSGPCEVLEADARASERLARFLGLPCRLVFLPRDFAGPDAQRHGRFDAESRRIALTDGAPLLLTSDASLADLNARLPAPVPMYRFRPNIVVGGAEPWAEDSWGSFTVGSVGFEAVKPCPRCAATTIDYATATRTPEPLRTLATFRKVGQDVNFGMNVAHQQRGTIRVGEAVRAE